MRPTLTIPVLASRAWKTRVGGAQLACTAAREAGSPEARISGGKAMATDQRIFSCDDHLDLWALPPDLWQARMPAALRDRAPRVVPSPQQDLWMAGDVFLGASRLSRPEYSAIARAGIQ